MPAPAIAKPVAVSEVVALPGQRKMAPRAGVVSRVASKRTRRGGSDCAPHSKRQPAEALGSLGPRCPFRQGGPRRLPGVAARDPKSPALAAQGRDPLAEDEGGGAGRRVVGELWTEISRDAWAASSPVVTARGAR